MMSRLVSHLDEAASGKYSHKCNWIRKIQSEGVQPEVRLIESVPRGLHLNAEIWWIAYYRARGHQLTNQTDGGQGRLNDPPWNKGLTKDDPRVADNAAKISAASKGRVSPLKGRKQDPEVASRRTAAANHTKRVRGNPLKGRKQSPELIAKRVASRRATMEARKNG